MQKDVYKVYARKKSNLTALQPEADTFFLISCINGDLILVYTVCKGPFSRMPGIYGLRCQ